MIEGETKSIFYSESNSLTIKTVSPQITFTDHIPRWFIQQFIKYLAKGQISIEDKDGNRLNVFYD